MLGTNLGRSQDHLSSESFDNYDSGSLKRFTFHRHNLHHSLPTRVQSTAWALPLTLTMSDVSTVI